MRDYKVAEGNAMYFYSLYSLYFNKEIENLKIYQILSRTKSTRISTWSGDQEKKS